MQKCFIYKKKRFVVVTKSETNAYGKLAQLLFMYIAKYMLKLYKFYFTCT